MSYTEKYLKYKTKYALLKKQIGGGFIMGEYDDTNPIPLFDYIRRPTQTEFITSYFECYKELYIHFCNDPDWSDYFIHYTDFLFLILQIRVLLDLWQTHTNYISTTRAQRENQTTYPRLLPIIEAIKPYFDNDLYIHKEFMEDAGINFYNEVLPKHDEVITYLRTNIPHMTLDMSDRLRRDNQQLHEKIDEIRMKKQVSTRLNHEAFNYRLRDTIKTIIKDNTQINLRANPQLLDNYVRYYKNIQKLEIIELDIRYLLRLMGEISVKLIDDQFKFDTGTHPLKTLYYRYGYEVNTLKTELEGKKII